MQEKVLESSLVVLWNRWLSTSNFQKSQLYVIITVSPGRVLRTRQKWCFVTVQNLSVPISWILGRALASVSQEGSSEVNWIWYKEGELMLQGQSSCLKRKKSEVWDASIRRGEGWGVDAIKVYKIRKALDKRSVELFTKLCNTRNGRHSKRVNREFSG